MWLLINIATLCGNVNTYHEIFTTICGIEVFLMSNQTDHTIVRLRVPPELKEKIEKSAEENNRSQSAEMVARLEQSFELSERQAVIEENHLHNIEAFSRNVEMQERLMLQLKQNEAIQEELIKTQNHLLQLVKLKESELSKSTK